MWYSKNMRRNAMGCVGSAYGVFPQYVIGFDLVNCLTYNVRKI